MSIDLSKAIGRGSLLLSIALSILGCGPRLPKTTDVVTEFSTITIDHFLQNFITGEPCYTTKSGPAYIDYDMSISVRYYDQPTNTWPVLAQPNATTYSPGPNGVKQPHSFQLKIPKTLLYKIEISVIGKACSTCANGMGGTSNNGVDQCIQMYDPISQKYTAAYPRWRSELQYSAYKATIAYNGLPQIFNVDNSCGCTVNP